MPSKTHEVASSRASKTQLDDESELGYSELDYAAAYLKRRFSLNARERLELRNAHSEPNPLFVLLRTKLGCIWRFREGLAGAPVRELSKLAGREGPVRLPLEDAPPPERIEPMTRVLRDAGMEVEVTRDLLLHRVGWQPTSGPAGILFHFDATDDLGNFEQTLRAAHMGSSDWKHCAALAQFDACEWVRFADLIRFVG